MDPEAGLIIKIVLYLLILISGIINAYFYRRYLQMERVPSEMWDSDIYGPGSPLTWFAMGLVRAWLTASIILMALAGAVLDVLHVLSLESWRDELVSTIVDMVLWAGLAWFALTLKDYQESQSEIDPQTAHDRVTGDRLYVAVSRFFGHVSMWIYSSCIDPAVDEEDVMKLVDEGSEDGAIEQSERDMIDHVFRFHDMPVESVMTHRTDVVAVDMSTPISEVVYTAINSGFSRIPVYRDNIDHIEGVICVKDLLCLVGMPSSDAAAETFMRDVEYIPRSCVCDDVFRIFTRQKVQMAVVVDEYGGTYGVVTMEDLVELVFGSIRDEYDDEDDEVTQISDGVWMIDGSAGAAHTMEMLGSPLPEDTEYDTMAGFVTALIGHIPEDGEIPTVSYGDITFTVLVVEDMRIEKIKATKDPGSGGEEPA
ncbi:MAG: HlyC/CorC family transporter [Oscillospiraceae bacterium]|nr:HlyC/CorC family transporter [Oscillospiraceae bacterium]